MTSRWLAIHTVPQREAAVAEKLAATVDEVLYLWTRGLRRQWLGNHRVVSLVERAYFPRYIFAAVSDGQHHAVKETSGVCAVVNVQGKPLEMPQRVVDAVRALADSQGFVPSDDECDRLFKPSFVGRVGDLVVFKRPNHILDGLIGRLSDISRLDRKGEIKAFVRMLGSEREMRLPASLVGAVLPRGEQIPA